MYKNSSAKYYKDDYRKKVRERYWSLPKEDKEKKQQYGCERHKNLPDMKNKSWLSIEKINKMRKKTLL